MTVAHSEVQPSVDALRPWPGLDAFNEDQSRYFFGREAETEELFRRVRHEPVTLLFGRSGLGKTSLLQAGLFPQLRAARFLPVIVRLDFAQGAPGLVAQVKAILERAFRDHRVDATPIAAEESLWEWLHRADGGVFDREGRSLVPALVFDQFEEIFTLGLERDENRTGIQIFLTELADLIENRPPDAVRRLLADEPEAIERYLLDRDDYRVVIALREDYLASLESLRARAPSLGRNRYRLRRMNGREALDAILNPAPRLIAPDLAGEIIRFIGRLDPDDAFGRASEDSAAEYEIEPALLSLVCSELNERRLAGGLRTITSELLAENRDTIIESFYERSLADQPAAVRKLVEDELLSESGFRESMSIERASRVLLEANVSPAALDQLIRRRLLRIEERLDLARIEIIHDVLVPVIRRSRETRHVREAERQSAERARALNRERRRRLWAYALAGAATLFAVAMVVMAFALKTEIRELQRSESENQRMKMTCGDKPSAAPLITPDGAPSQLQQPQSR